MSDKAIASLKAAGFERDAEDPRVWLRTTSIPWPVQNDPILEYSTVVQDGVVLDKNLNEMVLHPAIEAIPAYVNAPDLLEKLQNLVTSLDDLIASSEGVAGLHRNGDVATWDELIAGQFETWLSSIGDARDLLTKLKEAKA